jgi:transcriptional regulator with XRE-family HTH domain
MEDAKIILSQNLIKYRKALGLTQSELGEKLNYSDKAVSKWERAEGVPDVFVLNKLAELYGTTVDKLLKEPPTKKAKIPSKRNLDLKRFLITTLAVGMAWLVAVIVFVVCRIFLNDLTPKLYIVYLFAIPVSAIIVLVFSSIWHKLWLQLTSISTIIWTIILIVYVTLLNYWFIFLIGIPLQVMAIFWYVYKQI